MIEFKNCTFEARDEAATSLKQTAGNGLVLKGTEEILVENCVFQNRGYYGINVCAEGEVTIKDCTFECTDNLYNPIEGGQSGAGNSHVVIKNNTFNGKSGNNYINFYRFQDGAVIELEGNKFPAVDPTNSEVLRISNTTNANVTYNIKNEEYNYSTSEVGDFTAYIMCQDHTAKSGTPQDFTKVTLNLDNVKCNNQVIAADSVPQGKLTFTYQNGTGIIETNQPIINFV